MSRLLEIAHELDSILDTYTENSPDWQMLSTGIIILRQIYANNQGVHNKRMPSAETAADVVYRELAKKKSDDIHWEKDL